VLQAIERTGQGRVLELPMGMPFRDRQGGRRSPALCRSSARKGLVRHRHSPRGRGVRTSCGSACCLGRPDQSRSGGRLRRRWRNLLPQRPIRRCSQDTRGRVSDGRAGRAGGHQRRIRLTRWRGDSWRSSGPTVLARKAATADVVRLPHSARRPLPSGRRHLLLRAAIFCCVLSDVTLLLRHSGRGVRHALCNPLLRQ
jgi:hypothetical protein